MRTFLLFLLVGSVILSSTAVYWGLLPALQSRGSGHGNTPPAQLTLEVNATNPQAISINVTLFTPGNLTIYPGPSRFLTGLPSARIQEFTLVSGEGSWVVNVTFPAGPYVGQGCGPNLYPVAVYIMRGIYTQENYTQGKGLYTFNPTIMMCPAIYIQVNKIILHGYQGVDYLTPLLEVNGTPEFGQMKFSTQFHYTLSGYYALGFHPFSEEPGWYTVVAMDYSGQVVTQSFYVG